ncbi:MAG: hypothetical protein LKE41_10265 [Prevotella sp.]|nr:hypothetical protein [Prevotella sp.]MCI2080759.1 hypothetical protein [Prevotella sp.]MCI2102666.1 hypothetical protein [Prevotella sp.]
MAANWTFLCLGLSLLGKGIQQRMVSPAGTSSARTTIVYPSLEGLRLSQAQAVLGSFGYDAG